MAEVTLYRRRHCGLCDDALFLLRELQRSHEFTISERDIDDDAAMTARYGEVIPVVMIGDAEIARAPIDPAALATRLEAALGATGR